MATLDQAIEQMYAAGMPNFPDGAPRLDGRRWRYGPKGYGKSGRAYYKLYQYRARNGKDYVSGYFGLWGEIELTKISTDLAGIEPDELRRLQQDQAQREVREREKKVQSARFAEGRALTQWNAGDARLNEGRTVPYLVRKGLQWENGLRVFDDGTLLVPMVRYDVTEEQSQDPQYTGKRRLAGLQKISPDGAKLFNRGVEPLGAMCRFGRKPKDGDLLLLGEGLATVLSAHQGLERAYTSFVAFTAGNLRPGAELLRALYPKSPILIIADDDAYLEAQLNNRLQGDYGTTELYKVLDADKLLGSKLGEILVRADLHEDARGTPLLTVGVRAGERVRTFLVTNAGRKYAWDAAAAVGNAWVTWPKFAQRELVIDPSVPKLTDFNDLHAAEGIDRVVQQLGAAIKEVEDAFAIARGLAAGTPAAAPGGAGGKGGDDEPDWQLHGNLVRRFTLVERGGVAWDAERGFLWRIEHMRLSFGARPVAMWLASKRRRAVDLSQVVFDPRETADPSTTVNLFRGLELQPKAGSCENLLKLLRYLCGEEEATNTPISDWVLKWCACQVQKVGTKMQTAIVMYGKEGTGKNLFWRAMREIFGRYAALITQAELEDKHNTWLSAKLFLIANEVVTRAEMSHHVGRLKNLITEDEVYINPKMIDQRYERNHVNLVFCSNEFQPLKISPDDRRYMVIRTPPAGADDFYKRAAAEFDTGGAAAFLHHLRTLDLEGFNPHTKPLMTQGKRDLIEIGMLPSQLFFQDIKSELVPLPYCPCLSDDLYRAYVIWCVRHGHRMPEAQHRFTPAFMSMNGVRRGTPRVPDPDKLSQLGTVESSLKKRRVFYMGERPEDQDEREWVVKGTEAFRKALRTYESEGGRGSTSETARAGSGHG